MVLGERTFDFLQSTAQSQLRLKIRLGDVQPMDEIDLETLENLADYLKNHSRQ